MVSCVNSGLTQILSQAVEAMPSLSICLPAAGFIKYLVASKQQI